MTYTIKLCGGPGEGHIIVTTQRPMIWRLPIPPPISSYWVEVDPSRLPDLPEVVDYYDTNISTFDGELLYATAELLEQLRMAIRHRTPPRMEMGLEQSIIDESLPVRDVADWTNPAIVNGAQEYPWDAIKREDTERLLRKIDEITEE